MDACICSKGIRLLKRLECNDARPRAGYDAGMERDGSDPPRPTVLTTRTGTTELIRLLPHAGR